MRIRQAEKIINRVLSEPIDLSGSVEESVYKPTQQRLYKLTTYMRAKSRVEKWKAVRAEEMINQILWDRSSSCDFSCFLVGKFKLHEWSTISITAKHIVSDQQPSRSEMLQRQIRAQSDQIATDTCWKSTTDSRAHEQLHGDRRPHVGHTASGVSADSMKEQLLKLGGFRQSIDQAFDRAYYGKSFHGIAEHLCPITRFLFLRPAYEEVRCHFVKSSPIPQSMNDAITSINGLTFEVFDTIEQMNERAEQLAEQNDFGWRKITEIKDIKQ